MDGQWTKPAAQVHIGEWHKKTNANTHEENQRPGVRKRMPQQNKSQWEKTDWGTLKSLLLHLSHSAILQRNNTWEDKMKDKNKTILYNFVLK